MDPRDRRRFLRLAAASGCSLLLAPRPAGAFRFLPYEDYAATVTQACAATADHDRRLAQVLEQFGVTLSPADREAALAALTCPLCGCRLAPASPPTTLPDRRR